MDDNPRPEFNSSLQYLERISRLLWAAHVASMDDETTADELNALQQLHLELDPRTVNKKICVGQKEYDVTQYLEWCRKEAKSKNPEKIRNYFRALNRFAHSEGLIMKDRRDDLGIFTNES